jgi:putative hydrolase of the HAD superfamily
VTRGLLVDLDDTLYDYAPAHRAGLAAVIPKVAHALGVDEPTAERAWDVARDATKARLGATASSHSRVLYLSEVVHALGRIDTLAEVRAWDRAYWEAFLDMARLRPGATDLLREFRGRGGKVAIVTDLVLEVQIWKLERFGLLPHIDALAASEEVPRDKPAPELVRLAIARLGVRPEDCVMIGDSAQKDGGAARALGIPFLKIVSSEKPAEGGRTLADVAAELARLPSSLPC